MHSPGLPVSTDFHVPMLPKSTVLSNYNAAIIAKTAPRPAPMEPTFLTALFPVNVEGEAVAVVLRRMDDAPVPVEVLEATTLVLNPAMAVEVMVDWAAVSELAKTLRPGLPISAAVLPDTMAEVAAEVDDSEENVVEATDETADEDTEVDVEVVEAPVAVDDEEAEEVDVEEDEDEEETAEQLRSYNGVVLNVAPTTPKLGASPAS